MQFGLTHHPTSKPLDKSTNMEHCIGILIEPLVGLFTVCTEVFAICIDGCLQTCRESCRCISCCNNSSICNSRYDDEEDEEAQPILQQSQPTAQSQASVDGVKRWSSVSTLRDDSGRS
ncbi:hypothetical protein PHSY_000115 [Pseudozyma hubeiensis SY62]|uniref:Uncharacterized protein n=1 Tax=Pseudozyma hubeiensis (strain SY62) TaxID=1305764 RepID=R9NVV0_PSEHS|nr:hypothetical protein PHSY_000115 [Pseudozyma hubeiensis SY62]GAC92561.1 hypothetical protein PHSY_000115 [Pseudozyma hubeiensis SY62]